MKLFEDLACIEFQKNFPGEFAGYGCGPGPLGDYFVPDTVWFLSIREACRRHDWATQHSLGNSEADRKRNDDMFLDNMLLIVEEKTKRKWLLKLRRRRCFTYYNMVRKFGGPSYWKNRETANTHI